MHQLFALYQRPADPAAFDKHYREVHAPLAARIPGLSSYTAAWCSPGADGAEPPYYLVAVLTTDSPAAMDKAMSSPEGQAAVADLPNFAGAGVEISTGAAEVIV